MTAMCVSRIPVGGSEVSVCQEILIDVLLPEAGALGQMETAAGAGGYVGATSLLRLMEQRRGSFSIVLAVGSLLSDEMLLTLT